MNQPFTREQIKEIKCGESLLNKYPNRKQRREREGRFYGESKNFHLTVTRREKYKRVKQIEKNKDGNKKVIIHYLLQ